MIPQVMHRKIRFDVFLDIMIQVHEVKQNACSHTANIHDLAAADTDDDYGDTTEKRRGWGFRIFFSLSVRFLLTFGFSSYDKLVQHMHVCAL